VQVLWEALIRRTHVAATTVRRGANGETTRGSVFAFLGPIAPEPWSQRAERGQWMEATSPSN